MEITNIKILKQEHVLFPRRNETLNKSQRFDSEFIPARNTTYNNTSTTAIVLNLKLGSL